MPRNDPTTGPDPEAALLNRVLFDLASAGFLPAPPPPLTRDHPGGVTAYIDDDGEVVVGWLTHNRLDAAALDTMGTSPFRDDVHARYDAVSDAMQTALGTILHRFGYNPRPPLFGYGHAVQQPNYAALSVGHVEDRRTTTSETETRP
ncbi:hypothetical protein OHA69_41370 [Streptomyces anulatus]|uniref:hypothetical protein n=1 Tax=Streptomyces anulatus TaxID=1892 RepID=UPI00224F43CD|nr:hypothetical protein [Streptomyces anulatus]MCX4524044.1 hypothetical protein [Streptomyces anulatus]